MIDNLMKSDHEARPFMDRMLLVVEHRECREWDKEHDHDTCDGDKPMLVTDVYDLLLDDQSGEYAAEKAIEAAAVLSVLKFSRVETVTA